MSCKQKKTPAHFKFEKKAFGNNFVTDSLLACATLVTSSDDFYQVYTTLSLTRVSGDFYGFHNMALFPMTFWVIENISEAFGVVCM